MPELYTYYKFNTTGSQLAFRAHYFIERLKYIATHIPNRTDINIWDCGCGYGTTCLFLAMNGIPTKGSTLEFYFPYIEKRKQWWAKHGDSSLFQASYENLFDSPPPKLSADFIIVQDTLHHLEPIDEALAILYHTLKSNGTLIAVEENGNNLIQSAKLYRQRGNRRVIRIWDETLKKYIPLGNENIRSLEQWRSLFHQAGMEIPEEQIHYVRSLPPQVWSILGNERTQRYEDTLWRKVSLLREYFYFGLNFIVKKKIQIIK